MRTHNCLDSGPFGGQVTQESRARLQLPLSRVPHGGIRGTTVVNKDGGGDRHDMAKERVRQLVFLLSDHVNEASRPGCVDECQLG